MPAYRPTADCIWNSFRNSGKRHLLLTGAIHAGKTTLFSELLPEPFPGITTWAERGKGVWLKENATGETVQVGVFDPAMTGNNMRLVMGGFEPFGVEALRRCMDAESEWITIDEIGFLETACPAYCAGIRELMEKKRLIAVVRKQELPFLEELRSREEVFLVDLDRPFGNLGCVIMASGLGKRFGGNKLMADFRGKPLIQWALAATEDVFAKRVVVTRHKEVQELCEKQGIPVVLHALPHRSDTVRLGLQTMINDVDGCMFVPGDQPLLRRETVAALALSAVNDEAFIWRPVVGEQAGTPVLFPHWAFEKLLNLPEGKGGGHLLRQYPERIRTIPVHDIKELRDIDTPEDLETLLEQ